MLVFSGHHVVMSIHDETVVRIAEFKARLSQYLRNVRRGRPVTLMDRETPIARIVPYPSESGGLIIRKPVREAKDLRLPPPLRKQVNSLKLLMEDRQGWR